MEGKANHRNAINRAIELKEINRGNEKKFLFPGIGSIEGYRGFKVEIISCILIMRMIIIIYKRSQAVKHLEKRV